MHKVSARAHALVLLLLACLVGAGYGVILGTGFISDDFAIIRLITLPGLEAVNWGTVIGDFWTQHLIRNPLYRPMYAVSYGIDFALWGTWPLPYHLLNLAIHLFCSFFVYLLALELAPDENRFGVAVTAGSLFALHPVHPEAVTWIAGRVDPVCAAFYLPALLFFSRWLRTDRGRDLVVSLACFVLALASKEMAIILPALLFLVALYRLRSPLAALKRVAAPVVLLLAYLAFRTYILWGLDPYAAASRRLRPLEDVWGFSYRTAHLSFPLNFGLLPAGWQPVAEAFMFVAALAVLALAVLAWRRGRLEWPFALLVALLYVVSTAPVFKVLIPDPLLQGSRWLYIPSAFACLFAAYLVWSLFGGRRAVAASAAVCALALAVLLANQGPWLRASESVDGLLARGEEPELPVREDGAPVFLTRITWISANSPPFTEEAP